MALSSYAGLIALSAYYGSVGLVSGLLPVEPLLAERLPFQSPVFAGLALALAVGMPTTTAAVLSWHRHPRSRDAATLAGVALIGWIAVEVVVVRLFSPLQPICAATGLGLVLLGNRAVLLPSHPAATPVIANEGPPSTSWIDLYWLPLGAGGRSVRWNGQAYERLAAWRQRRPVQDLYHAALEVTLAGRRYVIEMAPVWNEHTSERGVVREGPVGAPWLGRCRAFRYEVRCWPEGHIPDVSEAVDSPQRLSAGANSIEKLMRLVGVVPALTWGRDELGAGDMWNSNSLVAWLLESSGHDMTSIRPPTGGRAPGWEAGLHLARCDRERGGAPGAGWRSDDPCFGESNARSENDRDRRRDRDAHRGRGVVALVEGSSFHRDEEHAALPAIKGEG